MMRALRSSVHGYVNRVLISSVLLIILTAVSVGIVAFGLARSQHVDQQVIQLQTAKTAVHSLFLAEQNRITSQLALFSDRPTLQNLLQTQQTAELYLYLQDFRSQSGLDFLGLYRANGELLASSGRIPDDTLAIGQGFLHEDGRPLLVVQQIIRVPGSDLPVGTAVAGVWLERPFLEKITASTGIQLSLRHPDDPIDTAPTDPPFTSQLPLTNSTGQTTLLAEVALPPADAKFFQELLLPLTVLTAVVALTASFFSLLLIRYLSAPLRKITNAARRISQGDVTAPLPLITAPTEIRLLATALHRFQAQLLTLRQAPDEVLSNETISPSPEPVLPNDTAILTAAGMRFDRSRHEVQRDNHEPVRLTPLEVRLLEMLLRHPGQVLSSETLITAVWGSDGGDKAMLKQLIYRLRSKIDPDETAPSYIETIPGVGYAFKNK
jgi:DNA-binding response OmpR family regulator